MKIQLDKNSINEFTNRVRLFVNSEATPSEYDKKEEQQENEMQKHFSIFMSQYYDVLREVSIPACGEKGTWEIDESMRSKVQEKDVFYTDELKFHGKGMSTSRQYVTEVKDDIKRMIRVSNKYFDVVLGGICFITCDSEEAVEVCDYARQFGLLVYRESVPEEGYVAVVATIVPAVNRDHTTPLYSEAWRNRLENVIKDGTIENNYFPYHVRIKIKK